MADRTQDILRRRQAGETCKAIATDYGLSLERVRQIAIAADEQSHGRCSARWEADRSEVLRKMWSQGLTAKAISRHLGISRNAIIGKAHRLGLDPRPSPIKRTPPPKPETNDEVLRRYGVDF